MNRPVLLHGSQQVAVNICFRVRAGRRARRKGVASRPSRSYDPAVQAVPGRLVLECPFHIEMRMAGKYVDFLHLLELHKGVVNMLAAFTTLFLLSRIGDRVVAHGVVARPARGQSFMHADYHSTDSTAVLRPSERAIKPIQLIAGEDAGRIVQRDEINFSLDPVIVRNGGEIGPTPHFPPPTPFPPPPFPLPLPPLLT